MDLFLIMQFKKLARNLYDLGWSWRDERTLKSPRGRRMKKHEYRCNRCLIIENKWISEGLKPLCSVACSKCGGLAIKLPVSESIDNPFKEIVQNPIEKSTLSI